MNLANVKLTKLAWVLVIGVSAGMFALNLMMVPSGNRVDDNSVESGTREVRFSQVVDQINQGLEKIAQASNSKQSAVGKAEVSVEEFANTPKLSKFSSETYERGSSDSNSEHSGPGKFSELEERADHAVDFVNYFENSEAIMRELNMTYRSSKDEIDQKLSELFSDNDPNKRAAAMNLQAQLGSKVSARAMIEQALNDFEPVVQIEAMSAIESIDYEASNIKQMLYAIMDNNDLMSEVSLNARDTLIHYFNEPLEMY